MKIELTDLTEDNMKQCFELKVASNQMQYITSNEDSWKEAKEGLMKNMRILMTDTGYGDS